MAIVISGVNNNDKITASDGTIDLLSGVNYVGIITAPNITATNRISSKFIDVNTTIQLGVSGIATATTFVGNLTGNVNNIGNLLLQISGSEKFRVGSSGQLGIGGANYGTSGQVLTSGGSGSAAIWETPLNLNDAANNRIITSAGGATLQGESNLTYGGGNLQFTTTANGQQVLLKSTGNYYNKLSFDSGNTSAGGELAYIDFSWDGDKVADIYAEAGSDTTNKDDGHLVFRTSPQQGNIAERLRIASDGKITVAANGDIRFTNGTWSGEVAGKIQHNSNNLYIQGGTGGIRFRHASSGVNQFSMTNGGNFEITNGDLVVASGHGIDFSNTSDGSGNSNVLNSEVFSDYERGKFEPRFLENGNTDSNYSWRYGQYVKVGNIVHIHMAFGISSLSGNFTTCFIGGLPFNMASQWGTSDFSYVRLIGYSFAGGRGDSDNTRRLFMELNQTHGDKHRIVYGDVKSNISQSDIGGSQRFAFQFSYPAA